MMFEFITIYSSSFHRSIIGVNRHERRMHHAEKQGKFIRNHTGLKGKDIAQGRHRQTDGLFLIDGERTLSGVCQSVEGAQLCPHICVSNHPPADEIRPIASIYMNKVHFFKCKISDMNHFNQDILSTFYLLSTRD